MLEALFTLFLSLMPLVSSQPASSVGPTALAGDSATSTLPIAEEDKRGSFDPDSLMVSTPDGSGEAPEG